MAALFDVPLRSPEPTDQEIAQARLGTDHVVRRIERTQHLVDRYLRVECTNQSRESVLSDSRVYRQLIHASPLPSSFVPEQMARRGAADISITNASGSP
jgi:hypothetical protein